MAKEIKLAYIISCYKLPEQVVRLIKVLNTAPGAFFLVHIDKKSPATYSQQIKRELFGLSNVVFLKRHNCYWGDFGHVRATVKAINYLVDSNTAFDYLTVLTGQDYPIKSNHYITKFLGNKSKSYIDYFPLPSKKWANGGMDRVEDLIINIRGKRVNVPRKVSDLVHSKLLKLDIAKQKDFKFYGGSSYFTLSIKHTRYIYHYLSKHKDYMRFFSKTYISDEIFFQTLLLNSKYKHEITNNNLRLIDWSGPVDYPTILESKDINKIMVSKELFARKFDITKDKAILDKLDKIIA